MEEKTEAIDQPHSVELSVSAKGLWSGKIKVYAVTLDDAWNQATKKAEQLESLIRGKNGM